MFFMLFYIINYVWYDITAFAADFIKESNIAMNASYEWKINSKTFFI